MVVDLVPRQGFGGPLPPPPPQEYLDENLAPAMLAVIGPLFGLAMLSCLLRVYVRTVVLKTFGIDDWMIMVSMILSTICFSLFAVLTNNGVGHHAEYYIYVRPDLMVNFFKIAWWYAWIIVIAYTTIKISIACFLLRLTDHRRRWRWTLYGVMVVLVLFTIGSVLSLILQCRPVSAAWDFSLREPFGTATCYSPTIYRNTGVFNSIFNALSDLILALLPVPMIWKIRATVRTRVSLCLVLGLGLFACATAIYKIPLQYRFFDEKDFSGKGAWYYVWQQIEMNTGIIAACLPTLKPLAADFFGVVSALTSGDRYGSRYASNGPSRANASKGYLRQQDRSGTQSFAMGNVGNVRNEMHRSHNDKDLDGGYDETYGDRTRRGSVSGGSQESVEPLHKGIMKTTEVQVS